MKRGLQYKNSLYKNQTCPTWTPPGRRSCSPAALPPSRQWSDLERLRQWGPSPAHEWTGFWRMHPVVVLPWMDKKRILILERKISNCSCAIQNIWEKIVLLTSCLGAYILNGYIGKLLLDLLVQQVPTTVTTADMKIIDLVEQVLTGQVQGDQKRLWRVIFLWRT